MTHTPTETQRNRLITVDNYSLLVLKETDACHPSLFVVGMSILIEDQALPYI